MKVEFTTGCITYNVDIDGECVMYMPLKTVHEKISYFINHLPDTYNYKIEILEGILSTLITECKQMSEMDVKYGSEHDENLVVNLISTKSYRIRIFYDSVTYKEWITINNKCDFDENDFEFLKHVLLELIDEFIEHPVSNEEHVIMTTLNKIIGTIMFNFGILEDISKTCECCGDTIDTYVLEL